MINTVTPTLPMFKCSSVLQNKGATSPRRAALCLGRSYFFFFHLLVVCLSACLLVRLSHHPPPTALRRVLLLLLFASSSVFYYLSHHLACATCHFSLSLSVSLPLSLSLSSGNTLKRNNHNQATIDTAIKLNNTAHRKTNQTVT